MVPVVKSLPVKAEEVREEDLIPWLGRSPGGVNGNPLQYSCKELGITEQPSTHKHGDHISQSATREIESAGDFSAKANTSGDG